MDTYDYIIVGAGSAGCVLANRLTENGKKTVFIIEAGPVDRNLMIHIPAGVYKAYKNPKLNWNYISEKEPELNNRNIDIPRGRVIGGSSSINSMVYMRGHPIDYDRWAKEFKLPNWTYAHCLPYFKSGENSDRGANEWRGDSGPLSVKQGRFDNPLYDAFLEAGIQAGHGHSEDLNGYKPEGVARLDSTIINGRRCSAAVAHLHPAFKRSNLTIVTEALVDQLIIDKQQVIGISYKKNGRQHKTYASKEIILSGGSINSPQLMMLSGIGPGDHLRNHNIDVIVDLPGVGQNLQDHATVHIKYACRESFSIHKVGQPLHKIAAGVQWGINRTGIAASNIWEAGGLVRTNNDVHYPNMQYHFGPIGVSYKNNKIKLEQAFTVCIDQLRPTSTGSITLKSDNAQEKPSLNFNYLATEHDRREMIEAVKTARALVNQTAFDKYRGIAIDDMYGAKTDSDICAAIRMMAKTDYHPCGTCRMGRDSMAVVDEEMRVHGIKGLRVVDASVIPQIISANLNAPIQMIAARAADFILDQPQLKPIHTAFHFN